MTIQEAIKSGKPFKRPSHINWYVVGEGGVLGDFIWEQDYFSEDEFLHPFVEDLLADDWEIKE